jgi:phenylacetate-CoA ligase
VHIWGSERDILGGSAGEKLKRSFANKLLQKTALNAFRMTPETMREFLALLNTRRPRVIIAYAQPMYELAKFARREGISIRPQSAIITSAGTLYPFMREAIEDVFRCKVFNRYGSREVGDIAGECSVHRGLHVLPWSCYVEVVDEVGRRVPAGIEGNIVVTCLTNFAMPLIRYQIGDRGILSAEPQCPCGRQGQILERVSGRNVDVFKTRDGTLVDGEYFTHLLYFQPWVWKFQVVQRSHASVLFRIQRSGERYDPEELAEIRRKTQVVMGEECLVDFEFVDDIESSSSGKYRYTMSEVGI